MALAITPSVAPSLLVLLPGCGGGAESGGGGGGYGGGGEYGGTSEEPAPGGTGSGAADAGASAHQSGQLTAGAWDDNQNYDVWTAYRDAAELRMQNAPRLAHERFVRPDYAAPARGLDVVFVVDTTGSMGDELSYLTREIDGIAAGVAARHPEVSQRFALVVYRDQGDEYVTRRFDFADVRAFRDAIGRQRAGGGGDIPEAPDQALEEASKLGFRPGDDTARVVFWVADAPHHAGNEGRLASAVGALRQHDAHIYPVAASGVDDLTEFAMRAAAQATGGRYLFLTDDSGIGNAHQEPRVPCYVVTSWSAQMARVLEIEIGRKHLPAALADVRRSVGKPVDGRCAVAGGAVELF